MDFKKKNVNPKKIITGDCVVRALMLGLNKSWEEIYTDLFNIGLKEKREHTDIKVIIEYLKDYKLDTPKAIKGQKRKKVKDYNKGKYILKIANHISFVNNNTCYDLWDCREKAVYRSWNMNKKQV